MAMMDWLDVLAAREILSGVPVFYYPRYLGILIMWEPKAGSSSARRAEVRCPERRRHSALKIVEEMATKPEETMQ
jgi:hypothetical protein